MPSQETCKEVFKFKDQYPDANASEISDATGYAEQTIYNCNYEYEKSQLLSGDGASNNIDVDNVPSSTVIKNEQPSASSSFENIIEQKEEELNSPSKSVETDISKQRKVKLAIGDLHLTDKGVMLNSIKATLDNAIDYIADRGYKHIEIINVGDTISGTGIFRDQELQNLTNTPHWQTLVGAIWQRKMLKEIFEYSDIESYEFHLIKGNHDQCKGGTDLAKFLAIEMKDMGIKATNYHGGFYVSDDTYVVHGYGNSDYRPQSPQFLRALQKRIHNYNSRTGKQVKRILHGHTHWADINFRYTLSSIFDCLGGFQKNQREDLGNLQRPAGFIIYEFENDSWEPTLIEPDKNIFYDEIDMDKIGYRNVSKIGKLLKQGQKIKDNNQKKIDTEI